MQIQWLNEMLAGMQHRGPDGTNLWSEGAVGLGTAMLHTTKESFAECQPVVAPELQVSLIMDGWLRNWQELRRTLRAAGVAPRDETDAELLLAAYIHWGESCAEQLDGDFAFAIWDGSRQRLICARDNMSAKPFYYTHHHGVFSFASEITALLALPWCNPEPDYAHVAEHLTQDWGSNRVTFWEGVSRLPGAHLLTVESGNISIRRYWQPDFSASLYYPQDEDYVLHYRELLYDVVRRSCRSSNAIACDVSGGLDSSAIFAVGCALSDSGVLPARHVQGYTMNFNGYADADEITYARAVARFSGHRVTEVPPSFPPLSWYRDRASCRREDPGAPNGAMSMGLFEAAQHDGRRVLLNGTGGDDWLGTGAGAYQEAIGCANFRDLQYLLSLDAKAGGWSRAFWDLLRGGVLPLLPARLRALLRNFRDGRRATPLPLSWLDSQGQKWLSRRTEEDIGLPSARLRWKGQLNEWNSLNDPYKVFAHECMEQLAAEQGLEVRRPYWTPAMVQFSISAPKRLLYGANLDRPLHRRSLTEVLPPLVLEREGKAEFSCTYDEVVPELVSTLTDLLQRGELRGVQPKVVRRLLSVAEESADAVDIWLLWALITVYDVMQTRKD
ncbi:MAG: asparagine synthase-related protein [Halioglobus sp.]